MKNNGVIKKVGIIVVLVTALVQSGLTFPLQTRAAAVQDNDAGTWTDAYADNTGLSLHSTANVNTSTGVLQLTNASSGFTAPYRTSGTARTNTIIPDVIGAWDNITVVATVPTSTTLTLQVLDGSNRAFSNTVLSGNGSGFSVTETGTSTIDISALQVDRMASTDNNQGNTEGSFPGIRVLFTLTTSDTDVTPSIDSVVVSWDTSLGDGSVKSLDGAIVPLAFYDQQLTGESPYNSAMYPAVRWVSDSSIQSPSDIVVASDGRLIVKKNQKSVGGVYEDGQICSYDRDDGSESWCVSDNSPNPRLLLTDSSIYLHEESQDNSASRDLSDGSLEWMHTYGSGHFQEFPLIDFEGNWISIHSPGDGTATLEAIDGFGSVVWSLPLTLSTPTQDRAVGAVLNTAGTRAYVRSALYEYGPKTSVGKVIAIDLESHSVLWTQSVLSGRAGFAVGSHIILDESLGYLLVDGYDSDAGKYGVFALNSSDGEEVWSSLYDGHTTYDGGTGYDYIETSALTNGYLVEVMGYYESDFSFDNDYLRVIDAATGDQVTEQYFKTRFFGHIASANKAGYVNLMRTSYLQEDLSEYRDVLEQRLVEDLSLAWKVALPTTEVGTSTTLREFSYTLREPPIQDERGWIYTKLKTGDDANTDGTYDTDSTRYSIIGIAPWTLSTSVSQNSIAPTENLTFTVTTQIPATNPISGEDNKAQVVFGNGDKVALSLQSDNGTTSVWSGSYQIPFGSDLGTLSYTIEAAQAGVITDTATSFASAPTDSENTGITQTGSLTITPPNRTSGGTSIEPEGGFSVNINHGDTSTDTREVTLSLNGGDRVAYMYVSEDPHLASAQKEAYVPEKEWTLSEGEGEKTIYAKFKATWGKESSIVSDTIVLGDENTEQTEESTQQEEQQQEETKEDTTVGKTVIPTFNNQAELYAYIQKQILLILKQIALLQQQIQALLGQ
jgi:hypothetical protein